MIDVFGACGGCRDRLIQEDGRPQLCDRCIEAKVMEFNPDLIEAKVVRAKKSR